MDRNVDLREFGEYESGIHTSEIFVILRIKLLKKYTELSISLKTGGL
jgi:hypothetical protein